MAFRRIKCILLPNTRSSSTTDSDARRMRKKEIAEHPDVFQVVEILREEAESQTHPVKDVSCSTAWCNFNGDSTSNSLFSCRDEVHNLSES